MQLKYYAFCGLLLFSVVFQDHSVDGQQQDSSKIDSNEHRRLPRSILLVKKVIVVGAIGLIAGLVIGHKKTREKNHIQAWHVQNYKKRSIGDVNENNYTNPDYNDPELLRVAKIFDKLGCGGRIVCQLHQQNPEDLNDTGLKIVQLFGDKQPPTVDQLKTDQKAVLQYAAFVGATFPKDLKICSRLFPRCPIAGQALSHAFSNANVRPQVAEKRLA